jgi:phosphoribosylformylglycinamidine synthase
MKSSIIVFPGSNRERDMVMALSQAFGAAPDEVWHTETELPETDLIVIPGGFSYGDYLRAGAMAAQSPVIGQVHRAAERGVAVFLGGYSAGDVMRVPVAHHDGNFFADDATLDRLEGEGRVAVRYCDADGKLTDAANPNGSQRAIAGIYNDAGNVLGMMPHPEDAIEDLIGGTGGKALFDGVAAALAGPA